MWRRFLAKSLNYFYDNEDSLQAFMEDEGLQEQSSILVQNFAGPLQLLKHYLGDYFFNIAGQQLRISTVETR